MLVSRQPAITAGEHAHPAVVPEWITHVPESTTHDGNAGFHLPPLRVARLRKALRGYCD